MSHFYPPYTPPQSTTPPQHKVTPVPPDVTGDYIIPPDRVILYPIPVAYIHYLTKYTRIAPLIPDPLGNQDFPLKIDKITPLIATIHALPKSLAIKARNL